MRNGKIKIKTTEHNLAIRMAINFLNAGYIITKAYTKKNFFSRMVSYIIEMEEGVKNYPHEIEKALKEERYEDVAKLKSEFDCNEILLKEAFEKQLKGQQEIAKNIFH